MSTTDIAIRTLVVVVALCVLLVVATGMYLAAFSATPTPTSTPPAAAVEGGCG